MKLLASEMYLFQQEERKIILMHKNEFRNFILKMLILYRIRVQFKFCKILVSDVSDYEDNCLLGCDTIWSGRRWKQHIPLKR